jgi:hypothetical protein
MQSQDQFLVDVHAWAVIAFTEDFRRKALEMDAQLFEDQALSREQSFEFGNFVTSVHG